jgi:hypothetical protein
LAMVRSGSAAKSARVRHMRDLAIPRASGPLSAWLVSSAAAVCLAATAPIWSGRVQWEPSLVDAALAGATVILAFLLVTMVRLAVLDWLAERQSRRAWAAISARADEGATAPVVEGPDRGDHAYAPALPDPAVSAILRAHRHAVPLSPTEAVPAAGNAAPAVGPGRASRRPSARHGVRCSINARGRTRRFCRGAEQ